MTKEMMEEKLYQRMQEENQQFLAELREQTACGSYRLSPAPMRSPAATIS